MWIEKNEINNSVYESLNRLDFSFLDNRETPIEEYSNEVKEKIFEVLKDNRSKLLLDGIVKTCNWIDNLEIFYRWKKKVKTCFKWDDIPFVDLLPYLFAWCKEASLWKRKSNRTIIEQDLKDVNMNKLHIIEAPSNLTKIEIFEEIRNAIEHARCIPTDNWYIFIDNPANPPKHAINFKAITDIWFLIDFILAQSKYDRRISEYYWEFDEWALRSTNISKDEVRKIFKFWHTMKRDSSKYPIVTTTDNISEISERFSKMDLESDKEFEKINLELTDNQCQMLSDFFATHQVDTGNTHYVASNLIDHNQSDMPNFWMLGFLWNLNNENKIYQDLIDDVFKHIDFSFSLWIINSRYKPTPEIDKILKSIATSLPKMKQKNWQPLLWHKKWIVDFIQKKFHDAWFEYDIRKCTFTKWDQKFWGPMWAHFINTVFDTWRTTRYDIEWFPTRIRIQLMRMIYANIPLNKLLEIEKKENLSTENELNWKKITDEEHIRNAFAHNTYTFLHWVDYILLRDWYNKKDNSWSWEKKLNINEWLDKSFTLIQKVFCEENSDKE